MMSGPLDAKTGNLLINASGYSKFTPQMAKYECETHCLLVVETSLPRASHSSTEYIRVHPVNGLFVSYLYL